MHTSSPPFMSVAQEAGCHRLLCWPLVLASDWIQPMGASGSRKVGLEELDSSVAIVPLQPFSGLCHSGLPSPPGSLTHTHFCD
jgi:hypothetical protein